MINKLRVCTSKTLFGDSAPYSSTWLAVRCCHGYLNEEMNHAEVAAYGRSV